MASLFPLLKCAKDFCELSDFEQLLKNALSILFLFAGGVAVLMALWAAYLFITSAGNEERATAARKTLWWALIGLLVIIFAYVLVSAVFGFITNEPVKFL
jgi:hypothetical protein